MPPLHTLNINATTSEKPGSANTEAAEPVKVEALIVDGENARVWPGSQFKLLFAKGTRLQLQSTTGPDTIDLTVEGKLGIGSYGVVLKVKETVGDRNSVWAMKIMAPALKKDPDEWYGSEMKAALTNPEEDDKEKANSEAKLVKEMATIEVGIPVRPKNHFFFDVNTGIYFIFTEAADGDLHSYMSEKGRFDLNKEGIEEQICRMLLAQATRGYACFDHKLANMLYRERDGQLRVYMSDFGASYCHAGEDVPHAEAYKRVVCLALSALYYGTIPRFFKGLLCDEGWTPNIWNSIGDMCRRNMLWAQYYYIVNGDPSPMSLISRRMRDDNPHRSSFRIHLEHKRQGASADIEVWRVLQGCLKFEFEATQSEPLRSTAQGRARDSASPFTPSKKSRLYRS